MVVLIKCQEAIALMSLLWKTSRGQCSGFPYMYPHCNCQCSWVKCIHLPSPLLPILFYFLQSSLIVDLALMLLCHSLYFSMYIWWWGERSWRNIVDCRYKPPTQSVVFDVLGMRLDNQLSPESLSPADFGSATRFSPTVDCGMSSW